MLGTAPTARSHAKMETGEGRTEPMERSEGDSASGTTLFLTGMQRSGTTLLEKLLCNHPRISVLSQPFPYLFFDAKRSFLRSIGRNDVSLPLSNLFLESGYDARDLARHLAGYPADPGRIPALFEEMRGYPGQYTFLRAQEIKSAVDRLGSGGFAAAVSRLYREFAHRADALVFGGKETTCEEFLPYFLANGCTGFLILRDPRDVLASLNCGAGEKHAGRPKPTLFNVRNWRKSVAFALHLCGQPRFSWMRYEDLVEDPLGVLNRLAGGLHLEPFEEGAFAAGILDQSGRFWRGNSSSAEYDSVSSSSVGRYRDALMPNLVRYVEAACLPELACLGYECSVGRRQVPEILRSFVDPYLGFRSEAEEYRRYEDREGRAREEIDRFALLDRTPSERTRPYFLFDDVHRTLSNAVVR
jgi:Sulfotransferase family